MILFQLNTKKRKRRIIKIKMQLEPTKLNEQTSNTSKLGVVTNATANEQSSSTTKKLSLIQLYSG